MHRPKDKEYWMQTLQEDGQNSTRVRRVSAELLMEVKVILCARECSGPSSLVSSLFLVQLQQQHKMSLSGLAFVHSPTSLPSVSFGCLYAAMSLHYNKLPGLVV